MRRYGGIDLHSNNSVVTLLDEEDRLVSLDFEAITVTYWEYNDEGELAPVTDRAREPAICLRG